MTVASSQISYSGKLPKKVLTSSQQMLSSLEALKRPFQSASDFLSLINSKYSIILDIKHLRFITIIFDPNDLQKNHFHS